MPNRWGQLDLKQQKEATGKRWHTGVGRVLKGRQKGKNGPRLEKQMSRGKAAAVKNPRDSGACVHLPPKQRVQYYRGSRLTYGKGRGGVYISSQVSVIHNGLTVSALGG